MSNSKKKKVVVTNQENREKLKPTVSTKRGSQSSNTASSNDLLFNKESFKWVGLGILLVAIGMILMMGGSMPSTDVWDESLIYSWRRTVLAPIFILAGLSVEIYAILKK